MAQPLVQVSGLTKSYGEYLAVDHISFEIAEGEILGVLGPNGAGKSTTIQMLLGLTEPDAGEIKYFGKNFSTNREACLARMNFASAYTQLQGRMTVYQNLRIYAGLYEVKDWSARIEELLKLLEIEELRNTVFWKLSSGQQTRAILAKALLNRPQLLLMDEPTASLDPEIVNKMIDLIKKLQKQENTTVLFTSHNMEEVARLCNRVMFLSKGKIVANDTPLELTKKVGFTQLAIAFEGKREVVETYLTKHELGHTFVNKYLVDIALNEQEIPKVLFGLKEQDVWVTNIAIEKPSLEDVFLSISQQHKL
jgi:ABC-2 type transport system ATP-binding protein